MARVVPAVQRAGLNQPLDQAQGQLDAADEISQIGEGTALALSQQRVQPVAFQSFDVAQPDADSAVPQ